MLKDALTVEVASWEMLGVPSLLQRFVLRNGKPFTPTKRVGHRRKARQCFSNAAQFVFGRGGIYVEGYAFNTKLPLMPIHHAWVTINGDDAMDPTLEAENYEYLGVVFGDELLKRELLKSRRYGILDTGFGLNHELMFEIDPELETIVRDIADKRQEKTA